MKHLALLSLSVALAATAFSANAVNLAPSSYDMNNGHGMVTGGQYNYWDKEYTGSGSTSTDNALLSGGLGNLTDGVTTDQNWFAVENSGGTGPYVGWRQTLLAAPSVLFNFAGPVSIDTIAIHADDSAGSGGVALPSQVKFEWAGGSTTLAVTDPDAGAQPSWLTFSNLGITNASSVRVSFGYSNEWVFVDEVSFTGAVPEPGSYALMAAGLLAIGATVRRRRSVR